MKVFLGGTINGSKWRDEVINKLKIDYFNPVVDNWNDDAYRKEIYERQHCDYCMYLITPRLEGYYSLAEVVDDSNKRPEKTVFCYIAYDDGYSFNEMQLKSLKQLGQLVKNNGAKWYHTVGELVEFLNRQQKHAPEFA